MKETNIQITQGDARVLPFQIRNKVTQELLDQSGGHVFFTLKNIDDDAENDDNALISIKQSATGTCTNLLLLPEHTSIPLGKYKYDIQYVDSFGSPFTYFIGICEITKQVTVRTA